MSRNCQNVITGLNCFEIFDALPLKQRSRVLLVWMTYFSIMVYICVTLKIQLFRHQGYVQHDLQTQMLMTKSPLHLTKFSRNRRHVVTTHGLNINMFKLSSVCVLKLNKTSLLGYA